MGSARGGGSGERRLEAAHARLARSILLGLGGHGLSVQVVAVLVEGMRPLRADQAIDGAESQHLPGILRELDGLELAVVALHSHLHGHPSLVIRAITPSLRQCPPRRSSCQPHRTESEASRAGSARRSLTHLPFGPAVALPTR